MADAATGYWDNQGAPATKATWPNPVVVPDAQKQNGGWYYNPSSGNVDRWWSGAPAGGFTDKNGVQAYTNGLQNGAYASSNTNVPTLNDTVAQVQGLLPTGAAPTAPNLVQTFKDQQAAYGVDVLNKNINDLTAQVRDLEAQQRVQIYGGDGVVGEMNKPVATNVIAGRVTEVQRNIGEQIDTLNRQKAYLVDQVTSANNAIATLMQYTQTDYTNARDSYKTKFSQAIDVINLARGLRSDQVSEAQHAQDTARANAQIMVNAITSGGIDLNSVAPETKAQLNSLEVQAGLPVGFFSALKKDPKADIVSTTSDNGQIQVLLRNPDGSLKLQTYGTKSGGGAGSAAGKATAIQDMSKTLNQLGGADGIVSPAEWNQARQVWISAGYAAGDFDAAFYSQYAKPAIDNGWAAGYNVDKSTLTTP